MMDGERPPGACEVCWGQGGEHQPGCPDSPDYVRAMLAAIERHEHEPRNEGNPDEAWDNTQP